MLLRTAVSAMKLIANTGHIGQLDSLGVSAADYRRLVGDAPWMSAERNRMTQVLHSLIMGSIDALGLPRFKVPAEYMAAGIAVFVSPVNVHAACIYAPTTGEAEVMARGASGQNVLPDQLFALVVQLYDLNEKSDARALFEKNVGVAVERALTAGQSNKRESQR